MTPLLQQAREALDFLLEDGHSPETYVAAIERCREALSALDAYEALSEYDKAVEALAPHIDPEFKWATCDQYGAVHLFVGEPKIGYGDMGTDAWRSDKGGLGFLVTDIMRQKHTDWRTSLREIRAGRVVPQGEGGGK